MISVIHTCVSAVNDALLKIYIENNTEQYPLDIELIKIYLSFFFSFFKFDYAFRGTKDVFK
jgi:hypothetical protein